MKKQFKVSGMACGHCRRSVEEALNSIGGVSAVVTLDPPVAEVDFSPASVSEDDLRKALSEAGDYSISE